MRLHRSIFGGDIFGTSYCNSGESGYPGGQAARYLTLVLYLLTATSKGKPNFAACLTSPLRIPSFRSMYLIEGEHDDGA
jgi:hypothetical protein